jgi:clorobiocin biosynthesis protein CloN5
MTEKEIESTLTEFIREEFLWAGDSAELTTSSPLLEWGILDSLRTTFLLAFIREKWGVNVSATDVDARNFRDIRSITAIVSGLSSAQSDQNEVHQ